MRPSVPARISGPAVLVHIHLSYSVLSNRAVDMSDSSNQDLGHLPHASRTRIERL